MDQQTILNIIPDIEYDELVLLLNITKDMNEQQQQQFLLSYRHKRKGRNEMLLLTLLGFVGVAGVQRFVMGDIALGIIYFLTGGLCLIGTIIDLIKINSLTMDYNQRQAYETASLISSSMPITANTAKSFLAPNSATFPRSKRDSVSWLMPARAATSPCFKPSDRRR